jgi:hypothetical protein
MLTTYYLLIDEPVIKTEKIREAVKYLFPVPLKEQTFGFAWKWK